MSTKPDALGYAFGLDARGFAAEAAELRRLYEAHEWQYAMAGERLRRIEKLEAVNATLLSALQNIALYTSQTHPDKEVMAQVLNENARIARAAIKKAEEVKP